MLPLSAPTAPPPTPSVCGPSCAPAAGTGQPGDAAAAIPGNADAVLLFAVVLAPLQPLPSAPSPGADPTLDPAVVALMPAMPDLAEHLPLPGLVPELPGDPAMAAEDPELLALLAAYAGTPPALPTHPGAAFQPPMQPVLPEFTAATPSVPSSTPPGSPGVSAPTVPAVVFTAEPLAAPAVLVPASSPSAPPAVTPAPATAPLPGLPLVASSSLPIEASTLPSPEPAMPSGSGMASAGQQQPVATSQPSAGLPPPVALPAQPAGLAAETEAPGIPTTAVPLAASTGVPPTANPAVDISAPLLTQAAVPPHAIQRARAPGASANASETAVPSAANATTASVPAIEPIVEPVADVAQPYAVMGKTAPAEPAVRTEPAPTTPVAVAVASPQASASPETATPTTKRTTRSPALPAPAPLSEGVPRTAAPEVQAAPRLESVAAPLRSAPAAPAQPEPNPMERAVAQQVSRAILQHLPDGGTRMVMRLTPPELGTVRVEFILRDGAMTARLMADDEGVRRALDRALPQIRAEVRGDHPALDITIDRSEQRHAWHEGHARQERRDEPRGGQRRRSDAVFSLDGVDEVPTTNPAPRPAPTLGARIGTGMVDALA